MHEHKHHILRIALSGMKNRIILSLVFLICIALAIAGCTGTQTTSAASPTGTTTGSSGSSAAGNLAVSPTDAVPDYNMVTVDVGEKDYLGNIPVIFQGGMGQIHVKKIDVTLYRSDGQIKTATIGINKGDQAELEGTKQTDRVVVRVSMDNGQSFTINDVQSPYRTRQ
ncbi:MAG: hypothetical protein CVV30_03895 [Methanomicrobiales archaeon HGW-Methanomicrobiales-1]|jgi:hypothetical protein|nr:MAG: hypothetical protein CVV30_03895 [Methanomicrobiales archaeon HGW-Methanomicrobiales-1]